MTDRKMSAKGFLHKATSATARASALGFIKQHREYMLTGEIAAHTAPIIAKIDSGEIMPTPAMDLIKEAVFSHLMLESAAKAQKALTRAIDAQESESTGTREKTPKPNRASVLDEKGNVVTFKNDEGEDEDLSKSFDSYMAAERWLDRRLFDNPNCTGEIATLNHTDSGGLPRLFTVTRESAMARILKEPSKPVCKGSGKGGGGLGFGVKVRNDKATFSHG